MTRNYKLVCLPPVNSVLLEEFRKSNSKNPPLRIVPANDMVLEIGIGLIPLVDKKLENNILDRIANMRKRLTREIGITVSPIRIMDNLLLSNYEYCIKIRGDVYGKYKIYKNKILCIENKKVKNKITGKNVKEPVFGISAILINKEDIDIANKAGYTIVDSSTIISTHLENIIKTNISKIFSYEKSKNILLEVAGKSPFLVEDIIKSFKFIEIKQILEKILSKNITLLNIEKIFEYMLENENNKNDLNTVVENIILKLNKNKICKKIAKINY
jgi:flagellar biosynthesis protein FlhA